MEGDSPPTWPQQTAAFLHHRRRPSLRLLNLVFLILLIPILILFIIFLLIPSLISHTSNIKIKSLDYLNLSLLLFAILCGLFGKRNDNASQTKSKPLEASTKWYEYPDRTAENVSPATGGSRLKRNSSSYPDLRQATEPENRYNQFRIFDDFDLDNYRLSSLAAAAVAGQNRRRHEAAEDRDDSHIKVIPVDTFEVIRSPQATPPPPMEAVVLPLGSSIRSVPKHSDIEHDRTQLGERKQKRRQQIKRNYEEIQKAPPPLPTPPTVPFNGLFKKGNKINKVHSLSDLRSVSSTLPPSPRSIFNDLFKSGSKSKRFQIRSSSAPPSPPPSRPALPPSSIFNNIFKTGSKSKRFQNQSRSIPPPPPPLPPPPSSIFKNIFKSENISKRFQNQSNFVPQPPPPPPPLSSILNNIFKSGSKSKRFPKPPTSTPPPPPPLPSSLFNNIFKSGSKNERYQSATAPPPPPLPPPSSIFNNMFKSNSKSKRYAAPTPPPPPPQRRTSGRPPLPVTIRNLDDGGEILNKGAQSPPVQIPSPPPLPSWMVDLNFVARGDFTSSPNLKEVDLLPSKETPDKMDGGDGPKNLVTCPSPDVNMKADTFIARLKGEWRLDKINSAKEKYEMSPFPSPQR